LHHPFFQDRRFACVDQIEYGRRTGIRQEHRAVPGLEETVLDGAIRLTQKAIIVSTYIHQAARLSLKTQLRPGGYLEEFLKGPESTRQRNEGVRKVSHERLPFMHGPHYVEFGQLPVRDLLVDKRLWNHPDDAAAGRETRIGESLHEPNVGASIDEPDTAAVQERSEFHRSGPVGFPISQA
jgi:hypothetical protein